MAAGAKFATLRPEASMAEQKKKDDTSEYSSSKAPETREHAEERESKSDDRLIPGGGHGTAGPTGMSALDRDQVPGMARADEKKRSD
jgi:hypothetical protein